MSSFLKDYRVIDLTHELNEKVPTWNGDCGFHPSIKQDYDKKPHARRMMYQSNAGVGTHMDAPSHFIPGGAGIADLAVENFLVPLCVIKVNVGEDADYLISADDVNRYEKQHGAIPKGSLVVLDTGWAQAWENAEAFRNCDRQGNMHFPGFGMDAIELLLERGIVGIGIDTLSPDGGTIGTLLPDGRKVTFPVHLRVLGEGKYILENLANLDQIPPTGALAIALPPKVGGGSEVMCRVIALVP